MGKMRMSTTEIVLKYVICVVGIALTLYNYTLIKKKTKRSKTTNSLEFCCVIQFIISLFLMLALATRKYEFNKYFNYISIEIIILSLCIQIIVWLSWFKVFRMQFAHIFSDHLYASLNYISFTLYIITTVICFISFFFKDEKVLGIKRNYVISILVLWFSLIELVISISTFILNYRKHKNWVKLREQQLQKLATINPTPLKMIPEDVVGPINPLSEDITKNSKLEPPQEIDEDLEKIKNSEGDNSVTINVQSVGPTGSQSSNNGGNSKPSSDIQKTHKTSNENLKSKGGSESVHSLTGSMSKKSCLSYECIDKTILHYMHDKSVDFANSDPRATENNIKLISILHILIYIFHAIVSILILIVLLFDWKYSLQLLLLYTQIEITIKLQDHFLLRQFVDLSLT